MYDRLIVFVYGLNCACSFIYATCIIEYILHVSVPSYWLYIIIILPNPLCSVILAYCYDFKIKAACIHSTTYIYVVILSDQLNFKYVQFLYMLQCMAACLVHAKTMLAETTIIGTVATPVCLQ